MHTYNHTLVLRENSQGPCIGTPALRRDFADYSQGEETGVESSVNQAKPCASSFKSEHFFLVYNFHLLTAMTSIMPNQ